MSWYGSDCVVLVRNSHELVSLVMPFERQIVPEKILTLLSVLLLELFHSIQHEIIDISFVIEFSK